MRSLLGRLFVGFVFVLLSPETPSRTFFSSEKIKPLQERTCSTSLPGGNQVDGLPPVSSLRKSEILEILTLRPETISRVWYSNMKYRLVDRAFHFIDLVKRWSAAKNRSNFSAVDFGSIFEDFREFRRSCEYSALLYESLRRKPG